MASCDDETREGKQGRDAAETQQPTKPDRTTINYTMGRDDETQCVDETRRNTTAASYTMASRDDETREGKQGRDAA